MGEPLFDPAQKRAIRRLEKALLQCADLGIRINGQCGSLIAWDSRAWTRVGPGPGRNEGGYHGNTPVETYSVKHAGSYVDSGADDPLHGDYVGVPDA